MKEMFYVTTCSTHFYLREGIISLFLIFNKSINYVFLDNLKRKTIKLVFFLIKKKLKKKEKEKKNNKLWHCASMSLFISVN